MLHSSWKVWYDTGIYCCQVESFDFRLTLIWLKEASCGMPGLSCSNFAQCAWLPRSPEPAQGTCTGFLQHCEPITLIQKSPCRVFLIDLLESRPILQSLTEFKVLVCTLKLELQVNRNWLWRQLRSLPSIQPPGRAPWILVSHDDNCELLLLAWLHTMATMAPWWQPQQSRLQRQVQLSSSQVRVASIY